eukprot:4397026-Amphidinium_carterae.1
MAHTQSTRQTSRFLLMKVSHLQTQLGQQHLVATFQSHLCDNRIMPGLHTFSGSKTTAKERSRL